MGGVAAQSKLYGVVVAVNIWVNHTFGWLFNLLHHGCIYGPFGWEKLTISAGYGIIERRYDGVIPWRYPFAKLIGGLLNLVDKHHNREALLGKHIKFSSKE